MEVSNKGYELKKQANENLSSVKGAYYRMKRSIEHKSFFGSIKDNKNF